VDNLQTQTQPTAPTAPNYLQQLAETMKRKAREHPNTTIPPAQPLRSGARITLKLHSSKNVFQLRIARTGLYPLNDSTEDGCKRIKAWAREIETFCRDFGVGADRQWLQGYQGDEYYANVYWRDLPE